MRRIRGRANDDEIIPCDLPPPPAMAFVRELLLRFRIVHQQDISITPPRGVERFAGPLRDHTDSDPALCHELRKNLCQQARAFDRGGGGQNDGLRRGLTAMDGGKGGGQQQQEPVLDLDHVSSLPAVLALPASANTVALIEMLIPISTAPSASANDSSP